MPEPVYDEERAAELAKALAEDGGTPDGETTPAAEPVVEQSDGSTPAPETTAPEPEAPAEGEEDEDFIPRADLESLLEGVEDENAREQIITAYKSFQSGFTKRNQEISELRRQFEGVDPQQARQAFDFVQNLTTDREFALQVHQELSSALQTEAGLSPRQADQEASRQIEQVQSGEREAYGIEPDNPLVKELDDLKAWRQEQEQREQRREVEDQRQTMIREIERQDSALRRDNPKYEEEDFEAIYRLAAATQGDLFAAQEYYEGMKDALVTRYVESKARVPRGVEPVTSSAPHSEEPVVITNTDQAHEIAKERFAQLLAARDQ